MLDLSYGDSNEFLQAVSQLKKLRILRLDQITDLKDLHYIGALKQLTELSIVVEEEKLKFDLVKMVDDLVKLTKLKFLVNKYEIGKRTYMQLVQAVERREEAGTRTLDIQCWNAGNFMIRETVKFKKFVY